MNKVFIVTTTDGYCKKAIRVFSSIEFAVGFVNNQQNPNEYDWEELPFDAD